MNYCCEKSNEKFEYLSLIIQLSFKSIKLGHVFYKNISEYKHIFSDVRVQLMHNAFMHRIYLLISHRSIVAVKYLNSNMYSVR